MQDAPFGALACFALAFAPPRSWQFVQSAGSGGYLSAEAFRYGKRSLARLGSVSGLAPGADPVAALRKGSGKTQDRGSP